MAIEAARKYFPTLSNFLSKERKKKKKKKKSKLYNQSLQHFERSQIRLLLSIPVARFDRIVCNKRIKR